MSKQLDNTTINNVFLTLAEIFREDHTGKWSFKEIGYRILEGHPNYIDGGLNFELVNIPSCMNDNDAWEITKRLVKKNKSAETINKMLEYIDDNYSLQPKANVVD